MHIEYTNIEHTYTHKKKMYVVWRKDKNQKTSGKAKRVNSYAIF